MYVHTWSHFLGVVCVYACAPIKKKIILRGMLSGWCLRNTSLLCPVHTLSFKHSDHFVRVHRPTSPLPSPLISSSAEGDMFFFWWPSVFTFLIGCRKPMGSSMALCSNSRDMHISPSKKWGCPEISFIGVASELWEILTPSNCNITKQSKNYGE